MEIFKRKIYNKLLEWKQTKNGKTALLIQGARRIGKSTIAEEFAKNEYESYILIDFSKASEEVKILFDDISDLEFLFFRLQVIYGVELKIRKSVIILDEIQLAPKARQAIKHLVKDGRYDYIETGSLISLHLKSNEILIPSEETKLEMFPMDFEEFRWALGDNVTVPLLKQAFDKLRPLGDAVHRKIMRDFRIYMAVGGMPQSVSTYIETNDPVKVDNVKREIISLYTEDFIKLDDSGRASLFFEAIPSQLTNGAFRYKVSSVIPQEKPDRVTSIIKMMNETMAVNVAYLSTDPNISLALTADFERFKMYTADTGLFITLIMMNNLHADDKIYQKLLADKLNVNLGYVFENVVAQILRTNGKKLYFNAFPTDDGKRYYEVDFLISDGPKISPIEVKSSGYKTHASLDAFCRKFSDRISKRYLIYTKDLRRDADIVYLPVYMTIFL